MEVNVTRLITEIDPFDLSAWSNAKEMASDKPLDMDRDAARDFFRSFGAWNDDEIATWNDAEVDALVLQFAACDLRELQSLCPGDGTGDIDWNEAETLANEGTVGGRLFAVGDELFIYIGD